jgi:hypothetical protein
MPTSVYLAYEGDEEPPPSIVRAAQRVAQRIRRGPKPEQIVAGSTVEVSPAPRIAPPAAIASLDGLPRRPLGPEEPANHDYVANIRDAIHQLVNIEMKLGSDELAPLALRHLRAARRRLDQRSMANSRHAVLHRLRHITRRDLQVALGVLWLLDGALQAQPFMFTSGFATPSDRARRPGPARPGIRPPITFALTVIAR